MSSNTAYPAISCPPTTPDWGAQDVWSSLRLPSGLGCSTILSPEGLQMMKKDSEWAADRVELLLKSDSQCRVVVLMGSTSDLGHCEKN